jgi:V-type H+-transporting ATPase subunit a
MCENYGERFVKFKRYTDFIDDLEKDINNRTNFNSNYFDILENDIIEDEKKINDLIDSYNQINENLEILIEKKCVYDKSSQLILSSSDSQIGSENIRQQRNNMEEGFQSDLNFLAGVIKAEDDLRMKRMIFRISRGRAIPTFFDLVTENKFAVEYTFNLEN